LVSLSKENKLNKTKQKQKNNKRKEAKLSWLFNKWNKGKGKGKCKSNDHEYIDIFDKGYHERKLFPHPSHNGESYIQILVASIMTFTYSITSVFLYSPSTITVGGYYLTTILTSMNS
jgi:hypothetical protein